MTYTSHLTFSGETTEKAPLPSLHNTDIVSQGFKLYIEGVQVPFSSISIVQTYGNFPTASIQVPPESGLLDITRGYEPKVHIFYEDLNYGGYRLLFWGHIKATSYSRSKLGQPSTFITFSCEHKNSLINQITLDFTGWASSYNENLANPNVNNGLKPTAFNSVTMIIKALEGVDGIASGVDTLDSSALSLRTDIGQASVSKIHPSLEKVQTRLQGLPGVSLNLWNQLKKGALMNPNDNLLPRKMWFPLVEEGLGFFKRMSGHPTLEELNQNEKLPYCNYATREERNILLAPCYKTNIPSAIQRTLSVSNIQNLVNFSGELTSYWDVLTKFYVSSKYDVLTLASPAEINFDPKIFTDKVNESGVEKSTIETIIKPQIPFYFSPVCNVLLPRMYHTVSISQMENSVPTRMTYQHSAMPNSNSRINVSYVAPPSIREAIAYNAMLKGRADIQELDIKNTTGLTYLIPGKYEQGIGLKHEKLGIPWWLTLVSVDKEATENKTGVESLPAKGTREYNNMMTLSAEWKSRYGNTVEYTENSIVVTPTSKKNRLDPFSPTANINPYQRVLFSSVDYEFSQRVAASRTGTIEATFNPYIVPGYPMDVIDDSPNHPSFHGLCTSVTHTITSRSVSTSIGMVAATTYAELSNFYIPPLPPFLQTALNIANATIDEVEYNNSSAGSFGPFTSTTSTLLQNPIAKATADKFYKEVFGVGSVAPDDLLHMATGRAFPVKRTSGILIPPSGNVVEGGSPPKRARENEDFYTGVGNLRLVSRPIESKESIESKFGYKFLDLTAVNYNNSFVNYVNPALASNLYLEPGASLFLDYLEVDEFLNKF